MAPKAAGIIHTDFEKGFISADVMQFDTLMELKSEAAVKAAGKLMMKGRNYEVSYIFVPPHKQTQYCFNSMGAESSSHFLTQYSFKQTY